jgi:hypothetical protein
VIRLLAALLALSLGACTIMLDQNVTRPACPNTDHRGDLTSK